MADVQLQKGFVPVANAIIDALMRSNLSARELRVTLAVIRLSYGWKKKDVGFSLADIEKRTGVWRQDAALVAASLVAKSILLVVTPASGRQKGTYRFNKDFDTWDLTAEIEHKKARLWKPRHLNNCGGDATSSTVGDATSSTVGDATSTKCEENGIAVLVPAPSQYREYKKEEEEAQLDDLLRKVTECVRRARWTLVPTASWNLEVKARLRAALVECKHTPERILECTADAIARTNVQARGSKLAYFLPVFDGLLAEEEPQAPNYAAYDPEFSYPDCWTQTDEVA